MNSHRPLLSNDQLLLICKALAFYKKHLEKIRDGRDFREERMCKNLCMNFIVLKDGNKTKGGRRRKKYPLFERPSNTRKEAMVFA